MSDQMSAADYLRTKDARLGGMTKEEFETWLTLRGFVPESLFRGLSGSRQWRFDWQRGPICVEYQGMGRGRRKQHERGAHETRSGLERDYRKFSEASICGKIVILCNQNMIEDGTCQEYIDTALERTEGRSSWK